MRASFPFDFEGGIWELIVIIPDCCLSINLVYPYKNLLEFSGNFLNFPAQILCHILSFKIVNVCLFLMLNGIAFFVII